MPAAATDPRSARWPPIAIRAGPIYFLGPPSQRHRIPIAKPRPHAGPAAHRPQPSGAPSTHGELSHPSRSYDRRPGVIRAGEHVDAPPRSANRQLVADGAPCPDAASPGNRLWSKPALRYGFPADGPHTCLPAPAVLRATGVVNQHRARNRARRNPTMTAKQLQHLAELAYHRRRLLRSQRPRARPQLPARRARPPSASPSPSNMRSSPPNSMSSPRRSAPRRLHG